MSEPVDEAQVLAEHLHDGDLLQIPAPEGEQRPPFIPGWFEGPIPVLVYPPLSERNLQEGDNVNLEISPAHIFYGALRELGQTQDPERAGMLQRLVLESYGAGRFLFEGDLQVVPLQGGRPDFLPPSFKGDLPVLIYPPLTEQGVEEGAQVQLEINFCHVYYGALRELAETADAERSESLRDLVMGWNPGTAEHLCRIAREKLNEDIESALLHYELAMELDDELYEAVQDAGMCHLALSSQEGVEDEEREDQLASAEELFRRAIELRPEAGLSHWSLARVLAELGAPEEAQEVLHHFLRRYPEGDQREMVEEALVHGFQQAEAPSEEQMIFQQGMQLAFGDDPAQAIELLRPLADAHPDVGEIWFPLGAAYRRINEPVEAERCLRRAARLAPQEPFIWWELSRTLAEREQWRPAEDAIRKALEMDPENPAFLVDLGRIQNSQGDRFAARETLEHAATLVPDDPEVQAALKELNTA